MTPRQLRPHQADAIDALRASLASGKRRPLLMAPTGYGKTVLAGEIIRRARGKGKRVCFVVPAVSLVDQAVDSLHRDGIAEIGVIQSDHVLTNWSKPVQVASIQTIARRGYPEAGLVLVDEAHKLFDAQKHWMAHPEWQSVPFIGLSATPWTKGLGKHYDDLIISATTQELIDGDFLAPFRVFAPDHPDLSGVKTVAGDFHEGQLAEAVNKPQLVANVVETWIRQGEGRPTLAFAVDCSHAKALQAQFEAAGIPCGYIDARTPPADRNIVRDKFHRSEYRVVCNVGTLTTGVDWDVRCIILARPTKSEMLFVQIIGRGLRTAEGKADCLILDHSDTHARLGFVTDIHHDSLDDGLENRQAKERKAPLPKECSKCHYLRPPGVATCPACGFKVEARPGVEHQDGQLAEITRGSRKNEVPAGCVQLAGETLPKSEFYRQLLGYAEVRGYREGWAANQYKSLVGSWPNAYRDASPKPPSREVRSWIKSRQISFVKAREKQEATHAS
ncbi:Helicase conserved C-terminal domain-containing protein [uncultured Gammaproteobacteria bacterium]